MVCSILIAYGCLLSSPARFRSVPVEIVAGLPAESPGSSQLFVGINQSSQGYEECRACQATGVHLRLPPVLRRAKCKRGFRPFNPRREELAI